MSRSTAAASPSTRRLPSGCSGNFFTAALSRTHPTVSAAGRSLLGMEMLLFAFSVAGTLLVAYAVYLVIDLLIFRRWPK